MKIEKLTDNKIRIILNMDDLASKNIDIHSLIKNSEGTQKFFKKILKEAQKEVGFDVDNSKLLIEAFISTDGFFILTFTKIDNNFTHKRTNSSTPKTKIKISSVSAKSSIYAFDSFEDFCSFCTYINNSKLKDLSSFAKNVSLYEYNSEYYLIFSEINSDFKNISLLYTLISEFAKLYGTSDSVVGKIKEYGNVIFKNNAIKNGIKFFAKT